MGPKTLLARLGERLRTNRELAAKVEEKNEILQRVRQQVANRDRELARLREELGRAEAAAAESLPKFSGEGVPVFFILGRARSGTTWLRDVLNSHPEILCWGEGRFFERSFRREDFAQWELKNIPPSSLYGAIAGSRYLREWVDRSVWAGGRDTDEHVNNLTRMAVEYFFAGQLSKTRAKVVGDKTPFVRAEVMEEIGAVYPEARVIHIIRDGRDVAVSLVHHMWNYPKDEGGVYDLEPEEFEKRAAYREGSLVPGVQSLFTERRLTRIATAWNAEVGKATKDGPAALGDNYVEVRYEDLLEDPAGEVRPLLEFLGVDAGEEMVEKCVRKAGFEQGANRKRGQEDSTSRFRKGVTGDWKNVFTEEDKRIFKETAGSLLVELGYEEDGGW